MKILAVRTSSTGEVFAGTRRDNPHSSAASADRLVDVFTELVTPLRENGVGAVGIELLSNSRIGAVRLDLD